MADGATVDHKQMHVIFGGHRVDGRSKGVYVSVAYRADATAANVGVDGEGFFVDNDDLSATVTVTLLQSSASNDVFSAALLANRETPGGIAAPLVCNEANGRTTYAAARAKVVKMADSTWSDGGEMRTWTLVTTRLEGFVGGLDPTPLQAAG
jgi:hypothetical protein